MAASVNNTGAAAAARAEADSKSIDQLPDIEDRIDASIEAIRDLMLLRQPIADRDFSKFEPALSTLRDLFQQRHRIEILDRHERFTCLLNRDTINTILSRIASLARHIAKAPLSKEATPKEAEAKAAARFYHRGILLHKQNLFRMMKDNIFSTARYGISCDCKLHKLPPVPKGRPLGNLALELYTAAKDLKEQDLIKLLNAADLPLELDLHNHYELLALFGDVIAAYANLPDLNDKHFQILKILIDAGLNFRIYIPKGDNITYRSIYIMFLYAPKEKVKACIKLMQFLKENGCDPSHNYAETIDGEWNTEWRDISVQSWLNTVHVGRPPFSKGCASRALEYGIRYGYIILSRC